MEVRNISINQVIGNRNFGSPGRSFLYQLFVSGLRTQAALFTLQRSIKAGNFKPFYGKIESERLFTQVLSQVFGTDHPDKMTSIGAWQHMLNNLSAPAVTCRSALLDNSMPDDRVELARELGAAVRKLKVVEDWIFHHQDRVNYIPSRGRLLLPDQARDFKPEIIKKALIVEADPIFAKLAERRLKKLDLEVVAVDPDRPIQKQIEGLLASGAFNDIDMVFMDGLEDSPVPGAALIKTLRAGGYNKYIVATSNDDHENRQMLELPRGADFAVTGKHQLGTTLFWMD